ncbi:MAG: hypothetical protein ACR2HG_12445 [Pyrinomonadaceae bacterium]
MNKKHFAVLGLLAMAFTLLPILANAQTSISDLNATHAAVLKNWLATKKGWRLALEKDYEKTNLELLRGEDKNLRPFYVAADFNHDKKEDFAVILTNGKGKCSVAVFNAPFDSKKVQSPAFFTDKIEAGDIVYFNENTKLLLVGPYASDAGFMLRPNGKTYKVAYFED